MHSEITPKLQLAFDNSSIATFKDCPKKYDYSILQGWRSKAPAGALTFGSAYHSVVEHFDEKIAKHFGREEALASAIRLAYSLSTEGFGDDNRRSRLSLIRSIIYYEVQFRNDPVKTHVFENGKVALEMSFRFELPFKAKTGEKFLYCGHIDKLATYGNALYALERKTTVSTLGESFYDRYMYSAQIGGYVYAGKVVFDTPVSGAIIEGCQLAVNFSRFGRVVVHRVNSHLEEWVQDLNYWIRQVEYSVKHDYFPRNSEACMKYGGCQFRSVCYKSPDVREIVLESDFKKEFWNPLDNRGDL